MSNIVLPALPHMLLFMLGVLVVSAFAITVAGHFPHEHRKPRLAGPDGTALLWATIVVVAALGVATLIYAWLLVPWYFAVIGGGLMILIAPYILHPLPNDIIDGRTPLVVLAALALAVGGGMWATA